MVLAEKFPETVITAEMSGGLFREYLRYDALILACAIRYKATFVTADVPLHALALRGNADCKQVHEFEETPPAQLSFPSKPPG